VDRKLLPSEKEMEKLRARFTRNLVTLPRLPNNLNYKVKSVPFEDVVSEEVSEEDEEDEESQPLRVSARKKTAPVEEKKKKVVTPPKRKVKR